MLADRFDVFLLDLDGVLYVGNAPLPGAVDAVRRLRRRGKTLRFLTNDPRPARAEATRRLQAMGFDAHAGEVVTSGWATAAYLRTERVASAYVVGSDGLRATLQEAGIAVTDEADVEAVVVGCDEHVDYRAIQHAATRIRRGARFVATNADATFPTPAGPYPATGAIVAAVEAAAGRRPTVVGKPEPLMFEMALEGVPPSARAVMIGDRWEIDVVGAQRAGIAGLLVGTEQDRVATGEGSDAVLPDLTALFDETRERTASNGVPAWRPDAVAPGVAAVLFDDAARVLLVRRADIGRWSLPMGHVEPGESVTAAVRREVREETGLAMQDVRLAAVYSDPETQVFRYPSGRVTHFVTCCFRGTVAGAPETTSGEVTDARFFARDALPDDIIDFHRDWIDAARTGASAVIVT